MTGPARTPQSSRKALAEAYEQAIKAEAEKRARGGMARKRSRRRAILLGLAWAVIVGCLGTMLIWPEWFGLKQVEESPTEREASIRMSLYVTGRRLKLYYDEHGKYPDKLEAVGDILPGIQYRLTPGGGYEMRMERGGQLLLLTSRDSLDAFAGPIARLLPRGR